ncbi:hypothetical protein [Ruegeria hyattellae]|uniref:hypothetical protein n=1 Tax=Ruegeria hyattellae TaxID=3233337 RepID=UPI00355ADC0C
METIDTAGSLLSGVIAASLLNETVLMPFRYVVAIGFAAVLLYLCSAYAAFSVDRCPQHGDRSLCGPARMSDITLTR